ncbi:hypothetical protein [Nocardioides flavescens]|uniref:Peptidase MA superfamily protein n=1 Tax=Nocardioides flavescens TaxID=2691959 RepID=A0A6L7F4I4_9ACTN|nr:hypothetical protein [Nocardioides flavescens]MXG92135.1 hypothetical protein [Nocardioides flavescens]
MQARRARPVALAVVVLLVAAVATWLAFRPDAYVAPSRSEPGARSAGGVDAAAASATLGTLAEALAAGDADAARAAAPRGDAAAGALLAAVATNAATLDVVDLTARYVDEVSPADASGRWQAAVELGWRFDGFDRETVREEVQVGFASDGADVRVTGFGGGDGRTPVWLTGPVEVRRSSQALVLVAGTDRGDEADTIGVRARRAVGVVERVLPQWTGGLVVEVPADEAGVDAALGASPGSYAQIAAVSASVDGAVTPGTPVHVFVNPEVYDALDPVGAQVVMSHEATHVATNAPLTAGVPLWLLEGFADYVALRDVDLPLSTTAAQVIAQVRSDGVPAQLPSAAEFDQTATHLGAAYESAWLVCRVVAAEAGEDALVGLYEQVSGGAALADALRATTGLTEAQLTTRWQAELRRLAAG